MGPALLRPGAARVDVDESLPTFLPDADYADAFATTSVPGTTARQWARRCLGGGLQGTQRAFGQLVWHGVLGFDLAATGAPGTMVGWQIAVDEPELFVLTVDGSRMAGAMIFRMSESSTTWTTAVRYRTTPARRIWAVAQHVHRALAARLLDRAEASLHRRTSTQSPIAQLG